MSVSISAKDLAQIARSPDRELRIEQQDGANVIASNEGWFGGRLARSLKIATNSDGRATNQAKQDQYEDAANAVYNTLAKTYGQDIALKAFKAGLGHETNGQWEHSWNHPITGRHIQKMLSTAEKELKANSSFRVTEGPWDAFRDRSRDTVTRGPALLWYQQSATQGSSPDSDYWRQAHVRDVVQRLQDQGQSGAPGFETLGFSVRPPLPQVARDYDYKRGLGLGEAISAQLLTDANARREPNDQPNATQDFWQLNVGRGGSSPGSAIGIRIDRDAPNTVHVFDPNRGQFVVPRDRLAGFLGQHLKDVYGDVSVHTLSRVDPVQLHGEFKVYDGKPIDYTITASQLDQARKETFHLGNLSNGDALVQDGPDTTPLSKQFRKDIDRIHMTVQAGNAGDMVRTKITPQNCDTALGNLLPGDLDDEVRDRALGNLSQLVGQSAFNTMHNAFHGSLRSSQLGPMDPKVVPSSRNIELRQCQLEDGRPGIEIKYDMKRPLTGYTDVEDMSSHSLTPDRDFVSDTMTLQVAFEDLMKEPYVVDAPYVPEFTISSEATRTYHIEQQPEPHERELSFETHTDGERTAQLNDLIPAYRMQELRDRIGERVNGHGELTLENQQTVSDVVFQGLHEANMTVTVGDGVMQPLRIADSLAQRFEGLEPELTNQELLEVTKLLDRGILDDMLCETARSLGMTPENLSQFMNTQRPLDIHINRLPDGAISLSLSTDVKRWLNDANVRDNLQGMREDGDKLHLAMTFRLKVSDDGEVERRLVGGGLADRVMHRTVQMNSPQRKEFRDRIAHDLSLRGNADLHLHDDFLKADMGRMLLTVEQNGEAKVLRSNPINNPDNPIENADDFMQDAGNVPENPDKPIQNVAMTEGERDLRAFVGGNGIEQDRAVARLSNLLNMSSGSATLEPLLSSFYDDVNLLLRNPDSGNIHLRMDDGVVEVNYSTVTPLAQLSNHLAEFQGLTPSTDHLKTNCQIRIPLAELRGEREPRFDVVQWPEAIVHSEGYRGTLRSFDQSDPFARPEEIQVRLQNDSATIDLEARTRDGAQRLHAMRQDTQTQRVVSYGDTRLAECALDGLKGAFVGSYIPEGGEVVEKSRDHSLAVLHDLEAYVDNDPDQSQQLSKLLNRRLIDETYRSTMGALGATNDDVEQHVNKGDISVEVQGDANSEWLNVRFCKQATGLFDCEGVKPFLEQRDIEKQTHRLDVSVEIRVRRQDLIDGHPERFELVHGAQLEVRPNEVQLM